MFILNLSTLVSDLIQKKEKKNNSKAFFNYKYQPATPKEIKESIKNLSTCSNCHFLIFDNYWTKEINSLSQKLCPTCGCKA